MKKNQIIILSLLFSLTACGGGKDGSTTNNSSNQADGSVTNPVPRPPSNNNTSPSPAPISSSPAPISQNPVSNTPPIILAQNIKNPILFVTQVPTTNTNDFAMRLSTFANHMTTLESTPRGGDLMIRYPDGSIRNLTKEAGYGVDGLQADGAIALREPTVHWSGTKAIFSMLIGGAPKQYTSPNSKWQIYEITGLEKGAKAVISKVLNQPNYNNVSPFYSSDDDILFTSDRTRDGNATIYPQLDEYESTPTNTGIWKLAKTDGKLTLLTHTVSGAFSPIIDSEGRIIFTRWDHLQRDQQGEDNTYGAKNYLNENSLNLGIKQEFFPEPRIETTTKYGRVSRHLFNMFNPWQINQDGTEEELLNHIGRHELSPNKMDATFIDDISLQSYSGMNFQKNNFAIGPSSGILQIKEDPINKGWFYGIYSPEFGVMGTSQIVRFKGDSTVNPEDFILEGLSNNTIHGRFRNPTPLTDGNMIATHTNSKTDSLNPSNTELLLKQLNSNSTTKQFQAGNSLTGGIIKNISWYDPDALRTFNGKLWEVEAVEVVSRVAPGKTAESILPSKEKSIFTELGIDENVFRNWLKQNNLSLIVTRNQTSRDRADRQQPFNLQVPNGVKSLGNNGKIYDISHYQIFQADSVRAYSDRNGRRPIAQYLSDDKGQNIPNPTGPLGSVKIATDGSTAAFVPSNRALTWQTTDASGEPVVRERYWLTFQPGEIRVCTSCHGANKFDQTNALAPINTPQALRDLLNYWKTKN